MVGTMKNDHLKLRKNGELGVVMHTSIVTATWAAGVGGSPEKLGVQHYGQHSEIISKKKNESF
jgi:hypothetical protein